MPELLRLLANADEKIEKLETQIAALTAQVRDLGGDVMDDKALEKFGQEMAAKKAAEEKRELEVRLREAEIQDLSSVGGELTPMATPFDLEALQDKQDEIERLQDLVERREAEVAEAMKRVADVTENLKIAEERTEHALAEREKYAERSKEFIARIEQMTDDLKDRQIQAEDYEMKM